MPYANNKGAIQPAHYEFEEEQTSLENNVLVNKYTKGDGKSQMGWKGLAGQLCKTDGDECEIQRM